MNDKSRSSKITRLAGLELNELLFAGILNPEVYDGSRIASKGTPIFDVNGELLFHRVPVEKKGKRIAFVDISTAPNFQAPFLALNQGLEWDEQKLISQAEAAAKENRVKFDSIQFVAYSYPKIAARYLAGEKEVLMAELFTWHKVPEAGDRKEAASPYFERWSYIESIEPEQIKLNREKFDEKISHWDDICPPENPPKGFEPELIQLIEFERLVTDIVVRQLVERREVRYRPDKPCHSPCYELRGQLTGVWCVAASVQMLLDFYRYNYSQVRIAQELNLGTLTSPNGLPYANDGDVVTVVEDLTNSALDATMNTAPTWAEFVSEVRENRPLISFVPHHARTVAGYTLGPSIFGGNFRGLLVYDPWPPSTTGSSTDGGVITRWENFDTHSYRVTFTAHLTLA